jgi:hypothetical protein
LPPMHETKIFKPLKINGIYLFFKKYLNTWVNKIFQSLKTFNIYVIHLWLANIDNQFILDPYAVTTYYT